MSAYTHIYNIYMSVCHCVYGFHIYWNTQNDLYNKEEDIIDEFKR